MSFNDEKPKLYKLIFLGLKDLTLAVFIGIIIFLPFYGFNNIRTLTQIECNFSELPENDLALRNWYQSSGITEVKIERDENKLTVTYKKGLTDNPNSNWIFPPPEKLNELGYKQPSHLKFDDAFSPSFNISSFISPVIICSQIGFLLVGLWRMRQLKKEAQVSSIKAQRKTTLLKILTGIFAGSIIVLFGFLYDLVFRSLLGFQPDASGIWNETKSLNAEARTLIMFLGIIIAPICEEIFFRGGIFKSFAQKGYVIFGVLFSSLIFATVHFDILSFPVYFVFGVILALTYLKTNFLVSSIIAHAINNAVAFYLIYAW
jgi:membrane protease YdiL (CAAX protease family)